MSILTINNSGVHWERIGDIRVAVWPKDAQPDAARLTEILPPESLEQIRHLTHGGRRGEWLATRVLSVWVTGDLPSKGEVGEPIWKNGLHGSITHKGGHVALCFASDPRVTCGLDLELCRDLDPGVRSKIMNADEWRLCEDVFGSGDGVKSASTLVFAAKEAIYKALFPLVGKVFWFEAVEMVDLMVTGDTATLSFRLCKDLSPAVSAGMTIRANAKISRLGGVAHWLVVASHAKIGHSE